jgi:DNA-binding transcriptional regulator WhiA
MNGVGDATNKKSKKDHLEIVVTYKDWNEMLSYALHAYHITVRISMSTTPYSLVFGWKQ